MEFLPAAFDALKKYDQFIIYKIIPSKKRIGKNDKLPVSYKDLKICSIHDKNIWIDHKRAVEFAKNLGEEYGVGFVFTEKDPFFFLDIDNCLDTINNKWSDTAIQLCKTFHGAAVEISSSGKGLHVIASGLSSQHNCVNGSHGLEFYTDNRFAALTGTNAIGNAGLDFSSTLPWLVDTFFKPNTTVSSEWSNTSVAQWNGPSDNIALLDRALKSNSTRSVFGKTASFHDLWTKNIPALMLAYPDPQRELGYDESSADAALAQHLAFWTGNNCERIQNLMLHSSLKREKWDYHASYLRITISSACSRQTTWLQDKYLEPTLVNDVSTKPKLVEGTAFLSVEEQLKHFEGCIYILEEHKVLTPKGLILKPDQFKVMYGGCSFIMDSTNERVTRNAWECFSESQAFRAPYADRVCFKPNLPPATILIQDDKKLVNSWWPITVPRKKGDIKPFKTLLEKILPDPNDQLILMSYIAAVVQYQGKKFKWCPVLQGTQGNGKTLITQCVAFAVGYRYSHFPQAKEIDNRFNGWLYGKIFIGIEDIYVPDSRLAILECLKPMITSEYQEVEPKFGEKISRDICANFIINTNHKEGIRKTLDDRRFAPFYTAQQSIADLERDGMIGNFFINLYGWLEKQGGYEIVAEELYTFEIPDKYNPATSCIRAPATSTTNQAVEHGRGGAEQEILECIDQGLPGFKDGWVSSTALERLFEKIRVGRLIPLNKRKDLMISLGYIPHPNLSDGRSPRIVLPDGTKPRLYVTKNHDSIDLQRPADIAAAYEEAQR